MTQSPCKDCGDRYVGCHGQCEAYNTYSENMQELNRIRSKDNAIRNYSVNSIYNMRKNHSDIATRHNYHKTTKEN